ncbi:MAG: hypothetical protein V2I43_15795 [Parvularcula sp.]|nr:hypothetical protein [Parvularcula sp.]
MARIAKVEEELGLARAEQREAEEASTMSAQALIPEPLNRPLEIFRDCTVCSNDRTEETTTWRAVESAPPDPQVHLKTPLTAEEQTTLAEVLRHSPKIGGVIPTDARTCRDRALRALHAALPDFFPNDRPDSIGHTGKWGAEKLGVDLFAAVAVAIEDPEVRAPANYLGRLVHPRHGFNVEMALMKLRKLNPPAVEIPRSDDQFQDEMTTAIAEEVGVEAAVSYLHPDRTTIRQEGRAVVIEVTGRMAHRRLLSEHREGVERAAMKKGLGSVVVRGRDGGSESRSSTAKAA